MSVRPIAPAMLARIVPGIHLADQPHNPAARGYVPQYHAGDVNHCPGCGRSHWLVGRLLAECAFCATAMPIREAA